MQVRLAALSCSVPAGPTRVASTAVEVPVELEATVMVPLVLRNVDGVVPPELAMMM